MVRPDIPQLTPEQIIEVNKLRLLAKTKYCACGQIISPHRDSCMKCKMKEEVC
jgi:hypothetical protein